MSIFAKTLLISALMLACAALPRFYSRAKEHSRILLLIGTGGLISLYFGDLLPDVLRLGGRSSIAIIVSVWAVYSLLHVFHLSHHEHDGDHTQGQSHSDDSVGTLFLLMMAMVSHCLSSGMLLALSDELSAKLAATVFLALIAHKGYEALAFSLLLGERLKTAKAFFGCIAVYAASFPLGVFFARYGSAALGLGADPERLKLVAMVISSVALGSLMGCMIHDFLIPSLKHVKARRHEAAWLVLGGALTFLFTMAS